MWFTLGPISSPRVPRDILDASVHTYEIDRRKQKRCILDQVLTRTTFLETSPGKHRTRAGHRVEPKSYAITLIEI